jgi:hypothetical protein
MRSPSVPRSIGGAVNADGTPGVGGPFGSRRASTGNYALAFPNDFRLAACTTAVTTGAPFIATTTGYTPNGCSVAVMNSTTGAATDGQFRFIAVGLT